MEWVQNFDLVTFFFRENITAFTCAQVQTDLHVS